ncbi:hypothetical protein FBU30_007395 [Linnemannia zychae]|nr:hypothetical protein FBU30_007395 [Linnemannia zychae]
MRSDRIFILPELVDNIAVKLSQNDLSCCVRVSKSWHADFIPYLWTTFSDETDQVNTWGRKLGMAVYQRTGKPQEFEWYMDVYRRHAPYIRHLTIHLPAILEACIEDAFKPLPSTSVPGNESTHLSPESTISNTSIRSSLTNLETLSINIDGKAFFLYFPDAYNGGRDAPPGSIFLGYNRREEDKDMSVLESERPFINACQRLFLCNPRLRSVTCPFVLQLLCTMPLIQPGHNVLKKLNHLSFYSSYNFLPVLPPTVTKLTILRGFGYGYGHNNPNAFHPAVINEKLEALDIRDVCSAESLQAALAQVPSLKSLTVTGYSNTFRRYGVEPPIISWLPSRITVLKCQQSHGAVLTSPQFKDVFKCFPLLVEYYDDIWISSIANELAMYCPLLEVIYVGNYNGLANRGFGNTSRPRVLGTSLEDNVSVLLSSLSRLRVLDIPYGIIVASDTLEKPWICMNLEEFWCQILQFPFMTKQEYERIQEIYQREAPYIGDPYMLMQQQSLRTHADKQLLDHKEECISTRRAILSQISKMTSLKYLSLGPNLKSGKELFITQNYVNLIYKSEKDGRRYVRYNDVLPDTLHLRLDCGLDQLASLTQLKYLGFESIDHQMEACDIEWIASHFPMLQEMRGLSTDNYLAIEPDLKVDALLAQMRKSRPFVKQGQSFGGYGTPNMYYMKGFGSSSRFRAINDQY